MMLDPVESPRRLHRLFARYSAVWTRRGIEPKLALLSRSYWHAVFIESRVYEGAARGVKEGLFSIAFSWYARRGAWGVRDFDWSYETGTGSQVTTLHLGSLSCQNVVSEYKITSTMPSTRYILIGAAP